MKKIVILLIGFIYLTSCNESKQTTSENKDINKEISFENDLTVKIIDSTGKELAHFNTEIADDEYKRQTGLMYRKKMNQTQAMLFVFQDESPRYFYMKNTYLPLDIIYADKNKKIVSWIENARPLDETSLASGLPAQYVLEIKGGSITNLGIKKGMHLDFKLQAKD